MSSFKETLGIKIKQGTLAVGATAVAIAGCAAPVDVESPVEVEPFRVEPPPCNIDSQPKTYEIDMKNFPVVKMGSLTLTEGNNPGDINIRLMSQEEASELGMNAIGNGGFSIDLGTGRTFQIGGKKEGGLTILSIRTTCDQLAKRLMSFIRTKTKLSF